MARHVRYAYFAELAQQLAVGWVATAHTLDDQAETVLHRLLRGTSWRGLRGIAPQRELAPGVLLVRPIVTETRAAVIDYLTDVGQPWCDDASNADPAYTRNRIRHELLPQLRTYNPAITTTLGQLADQAHELFADLEATVARLLHAAELPKAGAVCVLRAAVLAPAPAHHLRELFNTVWEREGWPRNNMTFALWNRVADVAQGRRAAWDLPDGLRITHTNAVVCVGPRS
jgi:tRNA(Ile)-lysidine synthase